MKFDVTAVLKANVSDFSRGLKEAQTSLESLRKQTSSGLDKVSQTLSTVGSSMFAVGAGMTAGFTVPIVGAIGGIVKSFASLEQNIGGTKAVFEDFAQTVQKEAESAYKNMGLSASDYMATANKMASLFQGSGIEQKKSMDLTTSAMQRAADVASVMGVDMSIAMESVAGAAKGNFTMMDNLGVSMNATTLEAYALEKGVNFKWETASNAEKAELAMQMFMDRTKQYDGNFLKESEKTVAGSLDAMKGAFQNFVAGLGNPEADIKQLMTNLGETVKIFAENVKGVIGTIWDNLPLAPWQKWVGAILVASGPVIVTIGSIVTAIGKIIAVVNMVSGAFSAASKIIGLVKTGLGALTGVLSGLSAPVLAVIAAVAALVAIFVYLWNTNEEFRTKVIEIWNAIKETINVVIQTIVDFVMQIWGTLVSWWNENQELIKQTAETVWNAILTVIQFVMTVLGPLIEVAWSQIQNVITTVWGVIKTVVETTINVVLGIIQTVMQIINGDWSGAWETIKGLLNTVWEAIKTLVDIGINFVKNTITNILNGIKETWENIWNGIKSFVSEVWENIKTTVSNKVEEMKQAVVDKFSEMKSKVDELMSNVKQAISDKWNEAVSSVKNFVSDAVSAGGDIINGFVEGVKGAAGRLISAVGDAVGDAIDSAKNLLGIKSPSRVFRQFGIYTDEGFVIGVKAGTGEVVKSMAGMANEAISAFTGQDVAGSLQSELGAVDGELGRLTAYDPSVSFSGGTLTVGQQAADIVLKMGNTVYRAFTEDITNAQEMELILDRY